MTTTLKAVLVGCGAISEAWLKATSQMPDLQLVGFVDINEDAARKKASMYGAQNAIVSTEMQRVLEQAAPDMVFDCTVPQAHFPVVMAALQHGCHVLGEKPMADSLDHARQMVEAARVAGKIYAVIQNRRYDPNIRRVRHLIASGAIGPITTINSDFYIGAHFRDFRDHMEHILLLDMAIHTFDAARLLSAADPVGVYCKEWNPAGSWYDHDASAIAIFDMTGDIVYNYRGSWCAEGLRTTWESDWRIIGERGSIRWDGGERIEAQIPGESERVVTSAQDVEIPAYTEKMGRVGGHEGVIRDFVECIRTGKTPETICTDNIKSLAMVFGAIESAETGQKVNIKI
jgi:predicted dehydrogenase